VSLPQEDAAILTSAPTPQASRLVPRLQQAIHLLRHTDLEQDYASAWDDWESSGDQALWEATAADGLADAAR